LRSIRTPFIVHKIVANFVKSYPNTKTEVSL
jgi:hypothetical protein